MSRGRIEIKKLDEMMKIPAAGIEPALPRERDFESRASTNSATPACALYPW